MTRSRTLTIVLFVLASLPVEPLAWAAGPKPKGAKAVDAEKVACGITNLPMAVGNFWTYKSNQNKTITVKIAEVAVGKDAAGKPVINIGVEELYDGRTIKTQWTCTIAGGLLMSPDSFFFVAEAGGGVGSSINIASRTSVTLMPDAQITPDWNWIETLEGEVVRTDGGGAGATHPPAKIELKRHVLVHAEENLSPELSIGPYKAPSITFELRGTATVSEHKWEIPANPKHIGTWWLVKGVGIIRLQDNFDKSWDLIDSNLLR